MYVCMQSVLSDCVSVSVPVPVSVSVSLSVLVYILGEKGMRNLPLS